jgi:hypothetical protein
MRGNTFARARVLPRDPQFDLDRISVAARALATRALCLFCLAMFSEHVPCVSFFATRVLMTRALGLCLFLLC